MGLSPVPYSIRLPFFWGEASPAAGVPAAAAQRGLLIGQCTTGDGVVRALGSADQAAALFGRGSVLHRMAIRAFAACPWGDWSAIGVADAVASTAAAYTLTVTAGAAIGGGTIRVWAGSDFVDVGVLASSSPDVSVIATAIAAAFLAGGDYPVTGTHDAGVATLTFKCNGTCGNHFNVAIDPDVPLPTGVSVAVAQSVTGATDPTLTATLAAIQDKAYSKIAVWIDSLGDEQAVDLDAKWEWDKQLYGHAFTAITGTYTQGDPTGASALYSAALAAPSPYAHWSRLALEAGCRAPAFEGAASLCGVALRSDDADPGLTIHGLALLGCKSAPAGKQFTPKQRNDLLYVGYTTAGDLSGLLAIDRCVTTRFQNAYGSRDERLYKAPKLWLAEWAMKDLRATMEATYARCRLVSDGGPVPPNCATPSMVQGTLTSWYEKLCRLGYAQDPDTFAQNVKVVRPEQDRDRLDALLPASLADNFEVFAPVLSFS